MTKSHKLKLTLLVGYVEPGNEVSLSTLFNFNLKISIPKIHNMNYQYNRLFTMLSKKQQML